jgi:glutamine amidotransferase
LIHLRHASVGKETTKNAHPFVYQNWVFEHNGGIDRNKISMFLDKKFKSQLKSDTDSEVYFLLIMQFLEETKDPVLAIKKAIDLIKKYNYRGLNFILSDGKKLYVFRDASLKTGVDREKYYVLNYLKKQDSIVFSSDPLDDEDWQLIDLGSLVIADSDLNFSVMKL